MWVKGQIIKHKTTGKLAVYGGFYYNENTGASHIKGYIPEEIVIATSEWKEVVLLDSNIKGLITMLFASHEKYDNIDFEDSLKEAVKLKLTSEYVYKDPVQTKYV